LGDFGGSVAKAIGFLTVEDGIYMGRVVSQVEVASLKGLPFAMDGHWILGTDTIDEEPGFASTG